MRLLKLLRLLVATAGLAASLSAAAVSPPPISGPAAVCLRADLDRVRANDFGVTLSIQNECFAPLLVRIHSPRGVREFLIAGGHRQRYLRGAFACQYPHREPPTCEHVEATLAPFARSDLLKAFGIADETSRDGYMNLISPLDPSLRTLSTEFLNLPGRAP